MRKHIRKCRQALGLTLLLASSAASALAWVGGGVEYFTSGVYLDYRDPATDTNAWADLSRESGFRRFVEANVDFPLTERTRLALAGRAYSGTVGINNKDSFGAGDGFSGNMDYKGARGELGVIFTPMLGEGGDNPVGFVAMFGLENSTQELKHDTYASKLAWTVPFVRLGAAHEATQTGGWSVRGGLIHPVNTKVHSRESGASSYPEESPSFYFGFGRRFARAFEAGLNYEGFRLQRTDANSDYASPRVETDTYQLYLKVGF